MAALVAAIHVFPSPPKEGSTTENTENTEKGTEEKEGSKAKTKRPSQ
jgi:hypothetical protein